jgi:ATP-binding cassette subfamily B protein
LASDRTVGSGLRVLGHAIREQPRLFAVGVGGSVLFGLLTIAGARVIGIVVGRIVVPAIDSGHVTAAVLGAGAAAIMAVSAGKVLGLFGRRLGAGAMQFRLQASYRRRVTRRYLELPLAWHHRHATGTLLSNANADVEAAFYPIAPLPFAVGTVVMLIVAVGSLFFTDWVLALVGVGVFVTLLGMNVIYSRRMSPRVSKAQQLRAEVSGIAHESFDGALVVKTMGREAEETTRFAGKAGELRDALISVGRVRGMFDPVLDALPSFGTLAVLLLGTWRLQQGAIGVADVVSVAFLFTVLAFPVRAIGWVLAELPRSAVGWERVQNVLTATGDMVYGTAGTTGHTPATLRFEHVGFAYTDGPPVLHDVSFEVPAASPPSPRSPPAWSIRSPAPSASTMSTWRGWHRSR